MIASRRTALLGIGAGLAAAPGSAAAGKGRADTAAADIQAVIRRHEIGNAALMRGDIPAYRAQIGLSDDFTLMAPFGGAPTYRAQLPEERIEAMGRFFRNGTFRQEVVQTYAGGDMVTLVVIERSNVEVGGLPAQDWALRVTAIYRRAGDGWRLAHRHADPLVVGISHERAAALARGDDGLAVWTKHCPTSLA